MRIVRRLLVVALLLALVSSGAALAARGDPQKRINPADQARAKAMLTRKADLGLGYRALPSSSGDFDRYCKALDESDLTVTGEAKTPTFVSGLVTVNANSTVYESVVDANASWRRGTSSAGIACITNLLRTEFAKGGLKLVSLRTLQFPRLSAKTVSYRVAFTGQSQGATVRAYVDLVVLQQTRAQVAVLFGSAIDPLERPEQVRIARILARRMAKAMRGA
jgi:hypothetical protein